jgi:hypothetical protein
MRSGRTESGVWRGPCILCLIPAATFHAAAADETLKFRTIMPSVQTQDVGNVDGPLVPLHGAGIAS